MTPTTYLLGSVAVYMFVGSATYLLKALSDRGAHGFCTERAMTVLKRSYVQAAVFTLPFILGGGLILFYIPAVIRMIESTP